MTRIGLALAAVCGATAAAQSPDAQTIVQEAAKSMRSVQTVTYDAKLEVRGGKSWRVVIGQVQLSRLGAEDPMGGRLAVQGEVTRSGASGSELFEAAYDGEWVRRVRAGSDVLVRGQPGFGGEELLRGSFGELILHDFLAAEPLARERAAPVLRWAREAPVGAVACNVVEVGRSDGKRYAEWWIGIEDHLPRKMRRRFRSARGVEVESELTLSNLRVNPAIEPAAFEIDVPDNFVVETVGKKPPPVIGIGDPVPDWTLKGSDGKLRKLSDYRGQLVVLDFWASWCPHCNRAMPAVQRMHDAYGERGVAFLALNCRDRGDVDPVKYIRDKGYDYFVADGNEVAIQYRVGPLPAFYIISPEGRLLFRQTGYSPDKERQLVEVIERSLDDRGR
jgi:thiol-disulfide isomerase/thioredoxin